MRGLLNPAVRRDGAFRGLFDDDEHRDVHGYFAAHPELPPTPLTGLRGLSYSLGLAAVDAKDETHRFGVNAFKIVGVRYAIHRLGDTTAARGLVCATAGNHGRAVARVARQKHVACTVLLPRTMTQDPIEIATRAARVAAMRDDGATVVDVDGTYEDAVNRAIEFAERTGATIVSDTSWDGYEQIPRWIMAGYTQIFEEALAQWDAPPQIVVVQGGVGGLVCAAASWCAWRFGPQRPFVVAAEPENAACLMASAAAGRATTLAAPLDTIMAGLRCAAPSPAAWPAVASGVDAFVSVPDELVIETMRLLEDGPEGERIDAGPSGACGIAALRAITGDPRLEHIRSAAGLDASSRALAVITEGR